MVRSKATCFAALRKVASIVAQAAITHFPPSFPQGTEDQFVLNTQLHPYLL